MRKIFLGFIFSSILVSALFISTNDEKVQAAITTNKASASKDGVEPTINSASELQTYLMEKYPKLITDIVTVKFDYTVTENDSIYNPYDYFINYDLSLSPYAMTFEASMNGHLESIKHRDTAQEDVAKARKQLNDFFKTMAEDLMKKMPNKKILGQDYDSWYTYKYIQRGHNTSKSLSWTNYEPIDLGIEWPGPQPDDYWKVTQTHYDFINKRYDNHALALQYAKDEDTRFRFRVAYSLLKYDEFKITEFGWRDYLDGGSYSRY